MNHYILRISKIKFVFILVFVLTLSFILTSCSYQVVSPESIKAFNENEKLWYQFKLEDTRANLKKILNKDPNYEDANRRMAFIEYYYYQNYDRALNYIKKAIKLQPKNAENHIIQGDTYFAMSKYEDSIKSYESALKLDDKKTDVYYSLAQAYTKLKRHDKARNILEIGNGINPFEAKISTALHLQYVKDSEYDKAYKVWRKGNVGDAKTLGYFKEWNKSYEKVIENKSANKHFELGNMYTKLLLYDEAKLELQRALKDYPGDEKLIKKLNEISIFIKFRDELKECFISYYPKRLINGAVEEESMAGRVEGIYKQMLVLFPDIKYNPLDFYNWCSYRLNNEIQKKFNVIINCWKDQGMLDCYFGYIVGDSNEEISQWGKKTNIRVTLVKNTVIEIFLDWYYKTNRLGGWNSTVTDENNKSRYENKIILDSKYNMAYDHWRRATNEGKRKELITDAEKSDRDLLKRPRMEVFYSSLLKLQFEFEAMDELIRSAKTKFHSEEDIKSYVINHLVCDVFIPMTYLHEGQHAIDSQHYNFETWELEYRAMMSEPVYGQMQLLDITAQLQQDIGDNYSVYGKAHTKIFTDIVNYINYHRESYPVIDTNKNIMMQLSKLSANDLKMISKCIFEQIYPGQRYE